MRGPHAPPAEFGVHLTQFLRYYYEQLFFFERQGGYTKLRNQSSTEEEAETDFRNRGDEKERGGGRVWARFLSCVVTRDPSYETIPKILRCWELCGTTMPAEQKGEKIP